MRLRRREGEAGVRKGEEEVKEREAKGRDRRKDIRDTNLCRRTGSITSMGSLGLSRLRGEDGGREDEGDVFGEGGRREGEELGGITIEDNRQRNRWFSFESLDDIQQNSPVRPGKFSSMFFFSLLVPLHLCFPASYCSEKLLSSSPCSYFVPFSRTLQPNMKSYY
jgi:hypothetical protein